MKAQVKRLMIKMTMLEMKITVSRINERLHITEKNSVLEDIAIETIQNEAERRD